MELALTLPGNVQITPPQQIQNIVNNVNGLGGNLFGVAIGIMSSIAALIALGFIAYGGIKWIMSEGDPKNIDEARKTIMYAVIGLSIVFFAYLIINFLAMFFGASLLGH